MTELELQSEYVMDFFCRRADGLGFREIKNNAVSPDLFIPANLYEFLKENSRKAWNNLLKKSENALAEVRSRGGFCVLFSQYREALADSCAQFSCLLPTLPEPLMPVVSVIPLQYFAYKMCIERGLDPDKPRNLAKSVTVE